MIWQLLRLQQKIVYCVAKDKEIASCCYTRRFLGTKLVCEGDCQSVSFIPLDIFYLFFCLFLIFLNVIFFSFFCAHASFFCQTVFLLVLASMKQFCLLFYFMLFHQNIYCFFRKRRKLSPIC